MKEKRIYTINTLPSDKTDWAKVAKLSDKEIEKAAKNDKNARSTSKRQLAKFKRVHPVSAKAIKDMRERLCMSQTKFASYFGINTRTLQEWEQGRRHPDGAACTLLMVINHAPKTVEKILMNRGY
jgi:putative transcriptional regulator